MSRDTSSANASPAPRRSRLARALLAFVPLLVLVATAELVLALFGLGEPDVGLPLSRGFDPDAPYLVPDAAHPGGWRTQLFGDSGPELVIPPKRDDVVRVVLLGGSNVQFFPEMLLRGRLGELLAARGDTRDVELLNLGREGYASERVAILLRQARALRPDAFVVYSGHNEFIERGFALELDAARDHGALGALRETFATTRLYRVLTRAGQRARSTLSAPEAIDPASQAFAGLPRSETERYFDAYEQNLRRMVALADEADVPLLLCTVVGNMLSPPYESSPDPALDTGQRERATSLRNAVLAAIPQRYRENLRPPKRLWARAWYTGTQSVDRAPTLRALNGPLALTPEMRGVYKFASVAGAHWPDPLRWEDKVVDVLGSVEQLFARELSDAERAELQAARALSDELLALDPDNPNALFDRGMLLWLLGDGRAAAGAFAAAAARDRAPRSGNDSTNARVRAVAAEHPALPFLDVDALFRARHPDGLIGYEATMDHCHLQPGARVVLMGDLADALAPVLAP